MLVKKKNQSHQAIYVGSIAVLSARGGASPPVEENKSSAAPTGRRALRMKTRSAWSRLVPTRWHLHSTINNQMSHAVAARTPREDASAWRMRRMAGCSGMPASSAARRRPPRTPSTRRCRSCRHDHRCADGMPGQLLCTAVRTTAHELLELGRGRRRTSCACDVGAPWIQRGAPEGRERTRASCQELQHDLLHVDACLCLCAVLCVSCASPFAPGSC